MRERVERRVIEANLLTLRSREVRCLGWGMSQPSAHSLDLRVFTISTSSFTIIEHLPKVAWVPAHLATFFMVVLDRAGVKGSI